MRITLRLYQDDCIAAFLRELKAGRRRHLVILPTGAGKTIVVAEIIRLLNVQTLFLAHRDELLQQAATKLHMVWPEADIGTVKGSKADPNHQVIVASIQTLLNPARRAILPPIKLIVYDECHHAISDKNSQIIKELMGPNTILLGVTATPNRLDRRALGIIFADSNGQRADYERSMLEMISEGYLAPIVGINGNLNIELNGVQTLAGDYNQLALSKIMNTPYINNLVYEFWAKNAKDRKTLVFAVDVKHANELALVFRRHGIRVAVLTGSMKAKERVQLLNDFDEGKLQVLVNVNILTEGFDSPSVSCILFARPTQSKSLYIQMVGRGLRLYPGKKDCLVLDTVKNTRAHSLVTIPDLFPKRKPPQTQEKGERLEAQKEQPFKIGRAWMDSQKRHVYSSEFDWELLPDGNFRLRLIRAYILLVRSPQGWFPVFYEGGNKRAMYDEPLTVDYAMGIAEEYVRNQNMRGIAQKDAVWKKKKATDGQKSTLDKFEILYDPDISGGEASKLISDFIDKIEERKRLRQAGEKR